MEILRYARFLGRWWWLLVAGLLLGGATSYVVSQLLTPVYRASATVLVNETQVPGTIAYNDILTSERLTKTYSNSSRSARYWRRSSTIWLSHSGRRS